MSSHCDPGLLVELNKRVGGKKTGKAFKKDFSVWGVPDLTITRWKFNEYDYYSEKADLPIKARGLFTLDDRILVRGYNKFFNTGEVKATKFDNIRLRTSGPYYATVKENGFLVLISAFQGKLVVTSKNSSGPDSTNEYGRNYSEVARDWVFKHLKSVGRTEAELAELLESQNWTAVGEVCDDEFEEHVLPYPETIAGIYLNGLNQNTRELRTEKPSVVNEVSAKFGFRKTDFVEFADLEELMAFLEGSAKTGKWQDREVEGFVIRCKRTVKEESEEAVDFFWKFKFEEPYLMYREWREIVKAYLQSGAQQAYARAKRSRHSESCMRFLQFARSWLAQHPELCEKLQHHNLGIIELRTQFFQNNNVDDEILLKLDLNSPKWLLVTVATLGCGKSTVSSALTYLFNEQWAHEQNDAVGRPGKGGKFGMLVNKLTESLAEKDVAILDKNNCGRDERKKIFTSFDELAIALGYDLKYVCLNFLPDGPTKKSKSLTRERVVARADNHQTVKLSQLSTQGINGIMSQFETRYNVVDPRREPDNNFDLVVDLVAGESEANVRRVLDSLRLKYPDSKLDVPSFSDEAIREAVKVVRERESQLAAESPAPVKKVGVRARFFGYRIDESCYNALVTAARQLVNQSSAHAFDNIRIQEEFHVTVAHYKGQNVTFRQLRKQHSRKLKNAESDSSTVDLGSKSDLIVEALAWNAQAMAFKVKIQSEQEAQYVSFPHITVGVAENVLPYISQTLFDGTAQDVQRVALPEPVTLFQQSLCAYCSTPNTGNNNVH